MTEATIPCDMFVDIGGQVADLSLSKLSEALDVLDAGKVVMAVSSKQVMPDDISAFCQLKAVVLVEQGEMDGQFYCLIRK